jgi:glycosyltransferase involved in cell wall biosynthesis
MRIAFLSQLLPLPLDAGPKIRSYYVLRHLAEAGHDVTLVCFVRASDKDSDVRALGAFCRGVETVPLRRSTQQDVRDGVRSLFSASPFLVLRDQVPEMSARIRRTLERGSWDAVHADQLWMAPYAAACDGVQLKVLDQHNAVFRVPERLAANERNPIAKALLRREAAKLARFERDTLDRFDRVVWVSEDDRAALANHARRGRRDQVIPIAVDPGATRPVERPRPFRVTFLGGIHWPPNAEAVRWFAERVWPKVTAAVPDSVFTVIGKGSPGRLGGAPRIAVTGYVPDLQPYLAETAAFVVPLLTGAGMRVKILDAWCWALPVVSTTVGAEGLNGVHGENLLIGDEPETFADHLIRILRDGREAARLARNGRATVEADYDWRKVYRAWDRVYS